MATGSERGFGSTQHPEQHAGRRSMGGETSRAEEGTLGGVAAGVKEKAQELASTVTSRAGEAWDTTRHAAQQAASTVTDTAETAWEQTASFMRRYPVATLCIGIGLGFLLSQFFRNQAMLGSERRHWQT